MTLAVLFLFGLLSLFFLDESILSAASFRDSTRKEQTTPLSSSCTEFRKYPFPKHHSGLPYLGDVFASHDASIVNFVAIHQGHSVDKNGEKQTALPPHFDKDIVSCVCLTRLSTY